MAYDTISIQHKYYTAAYDTNLRYPIIVRWIATQQMLICSNRLKRQEKFTIDPTWPAQTDNDKFYKKSGYDKGHNMPAFDNECSQTGNNECYYFSNITPQTPNLNRGIWKKLEDYTRHLIMEYDTVKVWCGSIGSIKKIGKVSVPAQCWKVLYIKQINIWEAYIFDQDCKIKDIDAYKVPVDSITKLTDFRF